MAIEDKKIEIPSFVKKMEMMNHIIKMAEGISHVGRGEMFMHQ